MRSKIIPTVVILFLSVVAATATKTDDVGQETVWDQIMAAQSRRQLINGSEYMENKQYDRATREFAKAVIARPNDPLAHTMLGAAYYWSGQVDQAGSEFRETLRLDPKNAQGHLLMGIVYAWKGDAKSAYNEFLEAEKYAPERPDVQMDLGSIEETLGMLDAALDHLRKAVKLDPDNAVYYYQLGMMYRHLGRDADAADSMNTAIKKNPEFEDAMLEYAAALDRQHRTQEAQDMFRKAVKLKAKDAIARLRLGREYIVNGNPGKAREVFQDAFHLTPDTGSGLALSTSFGGKPQASNEPSQAEPKKEPEEQPKDPLDMLQRNLERIPLDQDAKLSVEMIFLQKPKLVRKKTDEAPSSLKQALEQAARPTSAPMGIQRQFRLPAGTAEERESQIQKILSDLRAAKDQAPVDSDTRMAMNLNYVPKSTTSDEPTGTARNDAKEQPKASFNPHDVGNDMGLWVMGTGWVGLVEEVLPLSGEEATHPNEATWWITDGLAYATLGNGALALGAFERALLLDPRDELALLGRGVALVEMGDEPHAIAAYRKVLELYPKNKSAQDGLKWLLKAPAK